MFETRYEDTLKATPITAGAKKIDLETAIAFSFASSNIDATSNETEMKTIKYSVKIEPAIIPSTIKAATAVADPITVTNGISSFIFLTFLNMKYFACHIRTDQTA